MTARVNFAAGSAVVAPPAGVAAGGEAKHRQATAAGSTAAKALTKGSAMILPSEFLTTKLIGCRVVVFLTCPAPPSYEMEGTLLEVQDDDTLLLSEVVVYRSLSALTVPAAREAVDRLPKAAVNGKFVGMISLKTQSGSASDAA